MMEITAKHFLVVSSILFSIGVFGVLTRRNAIIIFMSIELMLNSVNLTLITFSRSLNQINGEIYVFFIMAVAACETAIGLAILMKIYRNKRTVDVDDIKLLRW